jgi:hypothetical protein
MKRKINRSIFRGEGRNVLRTERNNRRISQKELRDINAIDTGGYLGELDNEEEEYEDDLLNRYFRDSNHPTTERE